jgi:hypothetical protein
MSLALRLDRISGFDPGLVSTEHGSHICVTVVDQYERRTGACVFILSGTVSDNPLVFFESQTVGICFDLRQRN